MSDGRTTRLDPPVDPARDHVLGDDEAQITLVEYGSFACPYCSAAHEVVANLRSRFGSRLRYVFRHRPITGSADAEAAAVFAECANRATGDYWTVHDALMKRGASLQESDLPKIARLLELPPPGADGEAREQAQATVRSHRESAARSGAAVSPTFFINGRRYEGPWGESTLTEAMLRSPAHRVQVAALDFARWAPSTGLLLLVMSLLAVALSNSPLAAAFEALWRLPVGITAGGASLDL